MPSVSKKVNPVLYTKEEALAVTCEALYKTSEENLRTHKVAISVRGARQLSFRYDNLTEIFHVPRDSKALYEFCPKGYDHYEVVVNYTQDCLLHDQLMTRAEFMIEALDLWESLYNSLPEKNREVAGARFLIASDVLTSTYAANELTDLSYLEGAD